MTQLCWLGLEDYPVGSQPHPARIIRLKPNALTRPGAIANHPRLPLCRLSRCRSIQNHSIQSEMPRWMPRWMWMWMPMWMPMQRSRWMTSTIRHRLNIWTASWISALQISKIMQPIDIGLQTLIGRKQVDVVCLEWRE